MRFELRKAVAWLRDILGRACFWRWEIVRFKLREDSLYDILYVGRKTQREFVKVLLGVQSQGVDGPLKLGKSDRTVVVSEMPTPGALYVPQYLSAVVPLSRSIDEITARYNTELRRNLRKNRLRYRMKQALNDDEIEIADRGNASTLCPRPGMVRPPRKLKHRKFIGWQKLPGDSIWCCWKTRLLHAILAV